MRQMFTTGQVTVRVLPRRVGLDGGGLPMQVGLMLRIARAMYSSFSPRNRTVNGAGLAFAGATSRTARRAKDDERVF